MHRPWEDFFGDLAADCARIGLTVEDLDAYVGLPEEEARARARERGLCIRVVMSDGHGGSIEDDDLPTRINATTRDGVIERIVGLF